mgnify:CR=1
MTWHLLAQKLKWLASRVPATALVWYDCMCMQSNEILNIHWTGVCKELDISFHSNSLVYVC